MNPVSDDFGPALQTLSEIAQSESSCSKALHNPGFSFAFCECLLFGEPGGVAGFELGDDACEIALCFNIDVGVWKCSSAIVPGDWLGGWIWIHIEDTDCDRESLRYRLMRRYRGRLLGGECWIVNAC